MSTSAARIEANRKNAQLSTGPTSVAGKAASRGNALKHGLTATVVDLPPDHALAQGVNLPGAAWGNGQIRRVMSQIDRAQRIEADLRAAAVWRARTMWHDDRQVEVAHLGATLARDPARVALLLQQTPHGCDWLLERWRGLARVVEAGTLWNDEQSELVFDMLGVPRPIRTGFPTGTTPDDQARLARNVLTDLTARHARVVEADEVARKLASNDARDTPTVELRQVRRYELGLFRQLRWLLSTTFGPTPVAAPSDPAEPTVAESAAPNEAIPPAETKPTQPEPDVVLDDESAPRPARRHPDPAKLAQRDRKNRRKRQGQSRSR